MKSFGDHWRHFIDLERPSRARPIAVTAVATIVALGLGNTYFDDNTTPAVIPTAEGSTQSPPRILTAERIAQIYAVDELDRSIGAMLSNPECAGTNMRRGVVRIMEEGAEPLYLINPLYEKRPTGGKNSEFIGAVRGDSVAAGRIRVSFIAYNSSGSTTSRSGRTMTFTWLPEFEQDSSGQTLNINDGQVVDRVCAADVEAKYRGSVASYEFVRKITFASREGTVLTTQSGELLPLGLAVSYSELSLLKGTAYAGIGRAA